MEEKLSGRSGSGVHPDGSEYDHEELRNEYGIYGFERHKDWLRENLHDHPGYTLDLTRESGLECREVIDLKSPANGYENWCNFCRKLRDEGHQIFPVVQSYPTEDDTEQSYSENIQSQFRNLCEFSDSVVYRASVLKDSEFFLDIIIPREQIEEYVARGGKFVVVMDHEFIRTGTAILHALRTAGFIANLRTIISSCEIVVIGTSFPRDVEELGDPDQGSFRTEETFLYDEILRLTNDPVGIHYGDYGSINPERFDGITRGWRPRIDYPARDRRIDLPLSFHPAAIRASAVSVTP